MLIRKQRLLTPGPTPLYPPAVLAMAAADIHHRTEDFRKLSKQVISDLKYFMGTANDVLLLTSSGSGAMESAVSNLFSPGDKVLVATAGKFGERWVQMTKAFGLDVSVIEEPYGKAVAPERVAAALKADPVAGYHDATDALISGVTVGGGAGGVTVGGAGVATSCSDI